MKKFIFVLFLLIMPIKSYAVTVGSSNESENDTTILNKCTEIKAIVKCSFHYNFGGYSLGCCIDNWCNKYVSFSDYVKNVLKREDAKIIGINTYKNQLYVTWED